MIREFTPKPYEGQVQLPAYVTDVRSYTLTANTPEGYSVTLGRLTIGESKSAGNPLTHVLFESYDDHGRRCKTSRSRMGGFNREFIAVQNAMTEAGVNFLPAPSCPSDEILGALGECFERSNPALSGFSVDVAGVSQNCH